MRGRYDWDEIIREASEASLDLRVPSIGVEDSHILYSTAYLTALRFGRLLAMDAGAGAGFSTVWVAKAIYESGVEGRIYAVERSIQRFRRLERLVDKHGLRSIVTPVNRDALKHMQKVEELNLVFMDIDKEHYLGFFRLVRHRVLNRGVVLAHNVRHNYGTIDAFLEEASGDGWRTIIVPTEEGISMSIKTG